jgi:ribosome-associated protein
MKIENNKTIEKKGMDTDFKKELIIEIVKNLKADDVLIMKMSDLTSVTDYFILCSTDNPILSNAIVQEVAEELKKHRIRPYFYPLHTDSLWVVLDYGDVVLHIFHPEERLRYDLEGLWQEAPKTYISL